jgi:hypothetical protein
VNWPVPANHDRQQAPSLASLAEYLSASGWSLVDEDSRTSMWRPNRDLGEEVFAVLPIREDLTDYAERIYEALRTVAYVERRSVDEVASDIDYGAADSVAVRLLPQAPPGQAPLSLAYSAMSALRSYVIGSGSALDNKALVLPTRRPLRAESYVSKVRFATHPGSFILTLALPLVETFDQVSEPERDSGEQVEDEASPGGLESVQELMFEVSRQPFGRQITNRMAAVARHAQLLADSVNAGDQGIRAFGQLGLDVPNATELEALSGLGGSERSPYRLRFAQTPLAPSPRDAIVLQVTPGQQRIMADAAVYLRTEQPRPDVTVEGVVVRLSRDHIYGPGTVVVEGVADDSGALRRFYLELADRDYREALRAHSEGLRVVARGDLATRGSYKWLRPARSFAIIPGLEDQTLSPGISGITTANFSPSEAAMIG